MSIAVGIRPQDELASLAQMHRASPILARLLTEEATHSFVSDNLAINLNNNYSLILEVRIVYAFVCYRNNVLCQCKALN